MRALIVTALVAPAALAGSGFDGTWRLKPASMTSDHDSAYELKDGKFTCATCTPKYTIEADGKPHPLSGSAYADALSIRVAGDDQINLEFFKDGKLAGNVKLTASDGGRTLLREGTRIAPNGETLTSRSTSQRIGAVPASGNRVAGSWGPEKAEDVSANATTFTFKTTDGGLEMTDLTGASFSAKFDGRKYEYKGDPGVTHVMLRKIDDKTFEETDFRQGEVVVSARVTLSDDGKTLHGSWENKARKTRGTWMAERQ